MRQSHLKELLDKQLITGQQYEHLEQITTRKIFSVYYELRIILYLGVMLFTTGMGILIYKNIGDLGHLISITLLFVLTGVCFFYSFKYAHPYKNEKLKSPTPFFDYIVLLGCLLFIAALGYVQFQYGIFENKLGLTTLVTAIFFFYAAYRFDHLGVLSLAITALASYFSISVSPQQWYSGYEFDGDHLPVTGIGFGAGLGLIALLLDKKNIKQHFTFTYINFASLIYLTGCISAVFMNNYNYGVYLLLLFAGCGFCVYFAFKNKSFLFLLYAFLYGYVGITYFLADTILEAEPGLWYFYFLASCGGFIFFIVRYKNFFKRAE